MFALLPVVGGLLAGWLVPRRTAIGLQAMFYVIALAVLTLTAPDHGGSYRDVAWLAPGLALISAATLLIGLWLGRLRASGPAGQP
jgi:hypothetical protein